MSGALQGRSGPLCPRQHCSASQAATLVQAAAQPQAPLSPVARSVKPMVQKGRSVPRQSSSLRQGWAQSAEPIPHTRRTLKRAHNRCCTARCNSWHRTSVCDVSCASCACPHWLVPARCQLRRGQRPARIRVANRGCNMALLPGEGWHEGRLLVCSRPSAGVRWGGSIVT